MDSQRRMMVIVIDGVLSEFDDSSASLTDRQRIALSRLRGLAKAPTDPVYVVSGEDRLGTLDAPTTSRSMVELETSLALGMSIGGASEVPASPKRITVAPERPVAPVPVQTPAPIQASAPTEATVHQAVPQEPLVTGGVRRRVRDYARDLSPDAAAMAPPTAPSSPIVAETAIGFPSSATAPKIPIITTNPAMANAEPKAPTISSAPIPSMAARQSESFRPPVANGAGPGTTRRSGRLVPHSAPKSTPPTEEVVPDREDSTIIRTAKGEKLMRIVAEQMDDASLEKIQEEFAIRIGSQDRTLHGQSAGALDELRLRANIGGTIYESLYVEDLIEWTNSGRIQEDDLIAYDGSNKWTAAKNIYDLREIFERRGMSKPMTAAPSSEKAEHEKAEHNPGDGPGERKGFFSNLSKLFRKG
jgi:hypothetical protein